MATRGEAHARATAMAFNGASAAVQMAMLQGRLCRMRSSVRELLRRPQSAELRQLKRVLAPGGKAEERCVCGSDKKETRAHWETSCPMAAGQVAAVDAAMSELVAAEGCTFFFDVARRVGSWHEMRPGWEERA
eukprot:scaffold16333_cov106-Phaeocystis_antarctica.AAC.1